MSSDLSPPLSSSKIPSSVDRLRRHHFFLLSAFSAVFFVQTAFFFNEAVFSYNVLFIVFVVISSSPSRSSSRSSPSSSSQQPSIYSFHFRIFHHFSDYISTIFGTILSSFFGLNQTHYFMDNLTPVKHPSSLKHIY